MELFLLQDISKMNQKNSYTNEHTLQIVVFKNHKEPEKLRWNCREDVYKYIDGSLSDLSEIVVLPSDYQDRSNENCNDNGGYNPYEQDNGYDSYNQGGGYDNYNGGYNPYGNDGYNPYNDNGGYDGYDQNNNNQCQQRYNLDIAKKLFTQNSFTSYKQNQNNEWTQDWSGTITKIENNIATIYDGVSGEEAKVKYLGEVSYSEFADEFNYNITNGTIYKFAFLRVTDGYEIDNESETNDTNGEFSSVGNYLYFYKDKEFDMGLAFNIQSTGDSSGSIKELSTNQTVGDWYITNITIDSNNYIAVKFSTSNDKYEDLNRYFLIEKDGKVYKVEYYPAGVFFDEN